SLFVFRGNYIISGTISCVHKNPYNEFYKDSLYGFLFSTRSFFPASFFVLKLFLRKKKEQK
ncbi:hypothetical protein, partial [Limosilactobacillus reuteri]|uniref:hypothetical protein n=1 Tax=Limosilactobacillus reuteri TaxID=1598 RepID=UPI00214BD280